MIDYVKFLTDFWANNSENIIVSLVVGFIFFILGPVALSFSNRKIRKERIRKAQEMLIDILEGMFVNSEKIDNKILKRIYNAIERETQVSIDSDYDLEKLFEDLLLRFQRSKHLESSKKASYSEKIASTLEKMQQNENQASFRVLPRKYNTIVNEIKAKVNDNDREAFNGLIDELSERIQKIDSYDDTFFRVIKLQMDFFKKHPIFVTLVIIAYLLSIYLFTKR